MQVLLWIIVGYALLTPGITLFILWGLTWGKQSIKLGSAPQHYARRRCALPVERCKKGWMHAMGGKPEKYTKMLCTLELAVASSPEGPQVQLGVSRGHSEDVQWLEWPIGPGGFAHGSLSDLIHVIEQVVSLEVAIYVGVAGILPLA